MSKPKKTREEDMESTATTFDNVIDKDKFSKHFLPVFDNANAIDYYDIIINVDSFNDLLTGWEMKYSDKGFEQYQRQKDKKSCVVGIVGNANKGKTFILQQIVGTELPTGYSVKTEGLSLKYPKVEDQNIILLDSAGLETPLKNNGNYQLSKSLDNNEKLKEITAIARDKQLTELFLQQFVIQNSSILILVVGILTYSDQKLLNRIKRDLGNTGKRLFVIHNLFPYVTINQVNDYIDEVLKKSLTFKLEEQIMQNLDRKQTDTPSKIENNKYYVEEINKQTQNIFYNTTNIVHLIMANDSSEAGAYFNNATINHLKQQCVCFTTIQPFPIIEKLQKFLFIMSPKLMEKRIEKEEDIDSQEKSLKLKDRETIVLKRCLVDELGYSNFFGCAITPEYSYYIMESYFIIELEMPGEISNMIVKVLNQNENFLFVISGNKAPHPMNGIPESEFETNEETGLIYLELLIPHEDLQLKNRKLKKSSNQEGLVKLYFEIEEEDDIAGEQVVFE